MKSIAITLEKRLKPFAEGCFSSDLENWPQLRPLLRDIHLYLIEEIGEDGPIDEHPELP